MGLIKYLKVLLTGTGSEKVKRSQLALLWLSGLEHASWPDLTE